MTSTSIIAATIMTMMTRMSITAITIMTTMKTMMSMSITAAITTTMTMRMTTTSTTAAIITIITATTPTRFSRAGGVETPKKFTEEEIRDALAALDNGETYGIVLRAKGIVPTADGTWLHFDHVPGEIDVRTGTAAVTGRLCVIGSKLDEKALAALFGV